MSRKLPGSRNAIAGLGLAAAGIVYRRFRRQDEPVPAASPTEPMDAGSVDHAAVAQARSELADELARRAARSDG
jgi:hypothetical protein